MTAASELTSYRPAYRPAYEPSDKSAYELTVDINLRMICGYEPDEAFLRAAVKKLLSAKSTPEQARRFYNGVRYPGNTDATGRRLYPEFYIPPYNNGKKYRTVFGMMPSTHILSANMYELEILRLLYLFAPDCDEVATMTYKTRSRLKTACFAAADDGVGECFDTSLVTLRFLAATSDLSSAADREWILSRIENYNRHCNDKKRPVSCTNYYLLCLSELPTDIAAAEADKYKDEIIKMLRRPRIIHGSDDMLLQTALFCVQRNNLARYHEYAHIADRMPYVGQADGKLHFDFDDKPVMI